MNYYYEIAQHTPTRRWAIIEYCALSSQTTNNKVPSGRIWTFDTEEKLKQFLENNRKETNNEND